MVLLLAREKRSLTLSHSISLSILQGSAGNLKRNGGSASTQGGGAGLGAGAGAGEFSKRKKKEEL